MKYLINSIRYVYPDGSVFVQHFDHVPYVVDDIEALRKRLPTKATLYFNYEELPAESQT